MIRNVIAIDANERDDSLDKASRVQESHLIATSCSDDEEKENEVTSLVTICQLSGATAPWTRGMNSVAVLGTSLC